MPSGLSTAKHAMLSAHDEEGFLLAKTEDGQHHRRTRDALMRGGLVVQVEQRLRPPSAEVTPGPMFRTRYQITNAGRAVLKDYA